MQIAAQQFSCQADKTPVIDVHRHCMAAPSNAAEKMIEKIFKKFINWRERRSVTTIKVRGVSTIVYPDLMDIDAQVQSQDEAGITISLLSFSMQYELMCSKLFVAPENLVAKRLNDLTAELVAKYPGKLAFMANVNPATRSSVTECERCFSQLGAKGVNISTSWHGEFLDSEKLNHFW